MKLFTALKRLWTRRRQNCPPDESLSQAAPATHLEAVISEPTIVEAASRPEPPLAAVREQISKATEEFRRALDASTATAVSNYKRLRDAAESQHDEHLRSSLMAHADHQLIQSIRWLLDSDDQFTSATTNTHENS